MLLNYVIWVKVTEGSNEALLVAEPVSHLAVDRKNGTASLTENINSVCSHALFLHTAHSDLTEI